MRAPLARRIAALVAVLLLSGCATARSVQESVGGWMGRARAEASAEGEPRASYAAVDRIRVHREPDATSAVQGVLTLHEKVGRYQTRSGFAYVEAEGGIWGWVREDQLVERIPKRPSIPSKPEAAQPTAEEGATTAEEGAASPEDSPATEDAGPAEEEALAPDAEPPKPERSVFDPY